MKSLTLTIVIPVFNEQEHIAACLSAIAAQTVRPDEVIVVDNNSTDKTVNIVRQYSFAKLIRERKQGVLYAKNKGFKSAKSDIIGRIDADSILPPRWVESVKHFMEDGQYDALTGPVNYYDMPLPEKNYYLDHWMRSSIYNWSPRSPFLFGSNMAIRKLAWSELKSHLCHDTYMHEDLDLAIHLYNHGKKILYTNELLAGASG